MNTIIQQLHTKLCELRREAQMHEEAYDRHPKAYWREIDDKRARNRYQQLELLGDLLDALDTLPLAALTAIFEERARQDAKWGKPSHDAFTWLAIAGEEFGELSQAILHETFGGKALKTIRVELVQLTAVLLAWIESSDRLTANALLQRSATEHPTAGAVQTRHEEDDDLEGDAPVPSPPSSPPVAPSTAQAIPANKPSTGALERELVMTP